MIQSEFIKLETIFHLDTWQNLQNLLAQTTNLAIITVDYKGNPFTTHSNCTEFCNIIRNSKELCSVCQKCDSRGGIESARTNAPYMYLCHYNIVDIAIPIVVEQKYIGAIMAGQVRLNNTAPPELEKIISSNKNSLKYIAENPSIQKAYQSLPYISYEQLQVISELLYTLCNYMIMEALDKQLLNKVYKSIIYPNHDNSIENLQEYSLETVSHVKDILSNEVMNHYVKTPQYTDNTKATSLLEPAFEYINSHRNEFISLPFAAKICHISSSYFSRLFLQATGQNYTHYIAQLKVDWAKQLLEQTDQTIAQISQELGYKNPSYFIKTFKKQENLTPNIYRKYYKT